LQPSPKSPGPAGDVAGVDADADAVKAASAQVRAAGCCHAEVRSGSADDTGLPEASFDTVVVRHVLAHNGGAEQQIVDHAASLARPGRHVCLVDADGTTSHVLPSVPAIEEPLGAVSPVARRTRQ
jgi:2-polyprenyl-3-methyl-5-hydroxy-6-metoxy-1,4-benzoquinol methylase